MQSQDPRSWAELSHEIHVTQDPRGRSRSQRKRSTWTDSASISRPTNGGPGRNKYIEHQAPRSRYHRFPYIFFWYRDGDWDTHLEMQITIIDDQIMHLEIGFWDLKFQDFSVSNNVTELNSTTWLIHVDPVTLPAQEFHVDRQRKH